MSVSKLALICLPTDADVLYVTVYLILMMTLPSTGERTQIQEQSAVKMIDNVHQTLLRPNHPTMGRIISSINNVLCSIVQMLKHMNNHVQRICTCTYISLFIDRVNGVIYIPLPVHQYYLLVQQSQYQ